MRVSHTFLRYWDIPLAEKGELLRKQAHDGGEHGDREGGKSAEICSPLPIQVQSRGRLSWITGEF